MKKIIAVITILCSTLSLANDFTLDERAELNVLQIMLEAQQSQLEFLVDQVSDNEFNYEATTFLQISKKAKLKRANCGYIKASVGTQVAIFVTALEQSQKALEKIDFEQSDAESLQSNLSAYIKSFSKASDDCKKISKSLDSLNLSLNHLNEATSILTSYIPAMF